MKQLVLASHNKGKLLELREILAQDLPSVELIGYDGPEPKETGTSFEANALLKARAAAAHTGLPAIADDSGLSVEVMGGSPGIFSARWAGSAKSDAANLQLLLEQLSDIATEHRAAAFVCAAALALPGANGAVGASHVELGVWPGQVLTSPSGSHGFGYDPIFQPEGFDVSAAQLDPETKNAHSHRTRAFKSLAPQIATLIGK